MTSEYAKDLAERVAATFLGGVLGVVGTNGADITSLSLWESAAVAGGVAVISLVKGLLARYVGDKESAGLR